MDFNIEVRNNQLQSLNHYINSSKDKVQSIIEYLGWNTNKILEAPPKSICSINSNHRVLLHGSDKHSTKCSIKSLNYNMDEIFLSEPLNDPISSIKLDSATKVKILDEVRSSNHKFKPAWNGHDPDPMTSDRYFSSFSPDERLAVYDYCVHNTKCIPAPPELDMNIGIKKEERSLTQEEMKSKERDARRRRVKYKSVHTSRNKSHTEVIKEVLENQMEQYKEYLESKISRTIYSENSQNDFPSPTSIKYETSEFKESYEDLGNSCYPVNQPTIPSNQEGTHSRFTTDSRNRDHHTYEYQKNSSYNKNEDSAEYYGKYDYNEKYSYSSYKENRKSYNDYKKDYKSYTRDRREGKYKSARRY